MLPAYHLQPRLEEERPNAARNSIGNMNRCNNNQKVTQIDLIKISTKVQKKKNFCEAVFFLNAVNS